MSRPAVEEGASHCRTKASRLQPWKPTMVAGTRGNGDKGQIQDPRPVDWAVDDT